MPVDPTAEITRLQSLLAASEARADALAASEAQYRGLVQAGFDGTCLHEDGRVVAVDAAYARMLGYGPGELVGTSGMDLVAPEDHAEVRRRIRDGDERPYEITAIRKDGSRFPLEIVGRAVLHDERPMRLVACRDLGRLRRLERELLAQNERLKELDYLKSCFVGAVSHELRSPLTTIRGYAEFLDEAFGDEHPAEQRHYLHQVLAGTQRMERLVDDLLEFARLESGDFRLVREEADLAQVVAKVVQALAPAARARGLAISADVPAALPLVGDAGRLEQVLANLVGNALKFTPPGGRIQVRAGGAGAGEALVEVRDTGRGIEPQHLPHVFERFYQARPGRTRRAGGIGLGLAISRSLVEAHGGRMGVESAPGAGSAFWFTLPTA